MTARRRSCGPTSSTSRCWSFSIAAGSTRNFRASARAMPAPKSPCTPACIPSGSTGEATGWKRETANAFYIVLDGEGTTELAGGQFEWQTNDFFMVPNFLWRRHTNRGPRDAVLYLCSDRPLFEKIGQYRAQGRTPEGGVVQLVA